MLVKEGYGLALIREGSALESELTTRPVAGLDWTVDTAVIYPQEQHPKTIPVLVRKLKRQLKKEGKLFSSMPRKIPRLAPKNRPHNSYYWASCVTFDARPSMEMIT